MTNIDALLIACRQHPVDAALLLGFTLLCAAAAAGIVWAITRKEISDG